MARYLTVAALGAALPEKPAARSGDALLKNVQEFWDRELERIRPDQADLIVLPECCDRFHDLSLTAYRDFCRAYHQHVLDFFRQRAREYHCLVACAANRFFEDGSYANTVELIDRRGDVIGTYRKNYPTPPELTEAGIQPGNNGVIVDCELGKIGFAICFDLNFDPLFQFYSSCGIDLLLFSSVFHGGLLQRCRAFQCRAHLIGAVSGERCSILDPQGNLVAESSNYQPRICTKINLDCRVVHYDGNFEKLIALKQKYGSNIMIRDPGRLGTVLVSSESQELPLTKMLAEFEIEDLAHYHQRAMAMADNFRRQ